MGVLSANLRLDEAVAAHIRAAEKLARDAGVDLVDVGHVVAAMCRRESWLRDALGVERAEGFAKAILDDLGYGEGGIPAWSPALREAITAAGADSTVDENRLLAALARVAKGVAADAFHVAGPLPFVEDDDDGNDDDDDEPARPVRFSDDDSPVPSGGVQVWPPPPKEKAPAPEDIEVEVASIRIGPPTPALDKHGRDLIALARAGKLRGAYGRDEIFQQIVIGLVRQSKPHVMLVGEPGVGKTAIAEGLAIKLANNEVPELAGYRLVAIEPAGLNAGATYFGQLEERVRDVIREAAASKTLLFIDEIHGLLSSAAKGISAADVLKPALARSDLRVIGATTQAEYDRIIARDTALARRFERVEVAEPDADATRIILEGLRPSLEQHHGVKIGDDAIDAAIELTSRNLPSRHQPDKSIDVIDEACARARVAKQPAIDRTHVGRAVAQRAGVVVGELAKEDKASLTSLEARLAAKVIGQTEAVGALAKAIVRSRLGLKPPTKPVGAFLLWGPSGVGKTALATAVAEEAFGPNAFLRIDFAEYHDQYQMSRLIGAAPGYIGHDEEGLLTGWLRRQPHSVVLLDELDKAHPRIRELMLGVFDAGRLADGRGQQVSAAHALFVATGVTSSGDPRTLLGAELVGRLDAIIHMQRLGVAEYKRIARLLVEDATIRLAKARVTLVVDDAVIDILAKAGGKPANDGPDLGARPIRGAVERTLVDPIAKLLLDRGAPLSVRVIARDGKIGLVLGA